MTDQSLKEEPQYVNSVSVKLPVPTNLTPELLSYASEMTDRIWRQGYRYKKAGVFLTEMSRPDRFQPGLFGFLRPVSIIET